MILKVIVRLFCLSMYYSRESLKYTEDGEGEIASNEGGKILYNVSPLPPKLSKAIMLLPSRTNNVA